MRDEKYPIKMSDRCMKFYLPKLERLELQLDDAQTRFSSILVWTIKHLHWVSQDGLVSTFGQ